VVVTSLRVSVVMAVYDGERYLREAIESILGQTFQDFEFIIVDDASTDSTPLVLDSYTDPRIVRLRNSQRMGLARSLNRGLEISRGELVARQDADDVSLPERLATQVDYLQRHTSIGLLGTAYHAVDSQGRHIATYRMPPADTTIRWAILFDNAFCHTSVMFRRELLDTSGSAYNESLPYSQDYDLWARWLRYTRAANLRAPLVLFRTHESSTSTTYREEQQRIASTIATQQIKGLFPQLPLTPATIDTLRRWHHRLPQLLNKEDMELCRIVLQMFSLFEAQPNVDRGIARGLRRRWIDRVLQHIPFERQEVLRASGLLRDILREDPLAVVVHIPKRAARRIKQGILIVNPPGRRF